VTRLNDHLLLQYVPPDGVVLIDESDGAEIVVPAEVLARFADAAAYFAAAAERDAAHAEWARANPDVAITRRGNDLA
jgi:hypothetical protein